MATYPYKGSSALRVEGDATLDQRGVEEVWADFLAYFGERISARELDTWFRPITPLRLEGSTLTIRVPTIYFLEMLKSRYAHLFSEVLTAVLGDGAMLHYEALVDSSARNLSKASIKACSGGSAGQPASSFSESVPRRIEVGFDAHLIKNYTFETFLAGESNNVPRTVGQHIAANPGKAQINPFFIYGAPGVGKTHLLNAIGHQLLRNDPSLRVLYVSADNFVQQFTGAACNHKTADFTKFYRQVDALLLDDIQTLIGKTKTQEAFFQIFNHLYMLGKQLVLTCDKPPVELHGMEERMISRIAGSCIAQIDRPDKELRRTILEHKLSEEGIELGEEVKELIVSSVTSNLRELEGAITSLLLYAIVANHPIDLAFASKIIRRTVRIEEARSITLEAILDETASFLKISKEDIRSKSRKQEIVLARHLVMYLSKKHTDESYTTIGIKLGNRSHSTVLHGCKTIEDQLRISPQVRDSVKSIEEKLRL